MMSVVLLAIGICVAALAIEFLFSIWMERMREREHRSMLEDWSRHPDNPKWVKDDVMSDDSLPF